MNPNTVRLQFLRLQFLEALGCLNTCHLCNVYRAAGAWQGCAPDFVTVCMVHLLFSNFINVNTETLKSHLLMLFFS